MYFFPSFYTTISLFLLSHHMAQFSKCSMYIWEEEQIILKAQKNPKFLSTIISR